MTSITTKAEVIFNYETDEGFVTTMDDAVQDTMEILTQLSPDDYTIHVYEGDDVGDGFYEAVENIVTSYQQERISAERAMSAIAAVIADIESGVEV